MPGTACRATTSGLSRDDEREVSIPVGFPLQKEVLAGGNLAKALEVDGFIARVNVDLYEALGDKAQQAVSNLTALDIIYGPCTLLDMLATGGPQLLASLQRCRLTRDSLVVFVTFEDAYGRFNELQKSGPPVPAAFLFEDMLPELRTNREFLTFVRNYVTKAAKGLSGRCAVERITALQIRVKGRDIDLIKPPDDTEAIKIMLSLD